MAKRTDGKAPWDTKNPKEAAGKKSKRLTPAKKAEAKARAKAAGRPYPNLVDNMAIARKSKPAARQAKKRSAKGSR